jgi:hypothetical protein
MKKVKFYNEDGGILAVFPQRFTNLRILGTKVVQCYKEGIFDSCNIEYLSELKPIGEYKARPIIKKLKSIGAL